jgi:hypothetical protein
VIIPSLLNDILAGIASSCIVKSISSKGCRVNKEDTVSCKRLGLPAEVMRVGKIIQILI